MASEARGDVNLDEGRVAMTMVGLRDPLLARSNHLSAPYWY